MSKPPKNLSFLIKPASKNCNINCTYCFYHKRPDDPYAAVATSKRMNDETLEFFLRNTFDYANGGNISFAFQGGEPIMAGIAYFEKFCHLVEELGADGQNVSLSMQTNGMLLTPRFCELLKKYTVIP